MIRSPSGTDVKRRPSRLLSLLGTLLVSVVMVVLLLSAAEKAIQLDGFQRALAQRTVLPQPAIRGVSLGVVLVELLVSLGWFLGLWPRWAVYFGLTLLAAYTFAFWLQQRYDHLPECHCIILIDRFFARQDKTRYELYRNGILMVILVTGMLMLRQRSPSSWSLVHALEQRP